MGDSSKIVHWRPIPINPNNSLNTLIYSLVNWIWVPNVPSLLNVDQLHSAQILFLLDNVYYIPNIGVVNTNVIIETIVPTFDWIICSNGAIFYGGGGDAQYNPQAYRITWTLLSSFSIY